MILSGGQNEKKSCPVRNEIQSAENEEPPKEIDFSEDKLKIKIVDGVRRVLKENFSKGWPNKIKAFRDVSSKFFVAKNL